MISIKEVLKYKKIKLPSYVSKMLILFMSAFFINNIFKNNVRGVYLKINIKHNNDFCYHLFFEFFKDN